MPSSAIVRYGDHDQFQSSIRAAEVTVVVTQPGDFSAELTRIDLHRLWMQGGRSSLPIVARVVNSTSRWPIFFTPDPQDATPVIGGFDMTPGDIVSEPMGGEQHVRAPSEFAWASMSLKPDDLAAAGRALVGRDLRAPREFHLVRPSGHVMARLRSLHSAACNLAAVTPDVLAHPEVAKAMEQELIRAMIACLDQGALVKSETRRPVMRLFEQALEAHVGQPLYLTDLCAEIGVSDRYLRLHCQEHLGMSPHRYLWLRRMNMARRALARADSSRTSVTAVASDYGFGELGRFSVQYRRLFGEPPSVTLRRAPDEPRPFVTNNFNAPIPV